MAPLSRSQGEDDVEANVEEQKPVPESSRFVGNLIDTIFVVVLGLILFAFQKTEPRHVYIRKDLLPRYSYPYKSENSVPSWSVPVYSTVGVIMAMIVYLILHEVHNRWRTHTLLQILKANQRELVQIILSLLICVLYTAVITECLKVSVGRLRPNFARRCWGAGDATLESIKFQPGETVFGGYPVCNGSKKVVKEGRKSFPSGHASWSAAGLGFLGLWLIDRMNVFRGQAHPWRMVVSLLPFFLAIYVGFTRLMDYWHHWEDVLCGLVLGFVLAYLSFRQHYVRLRSAMRPPVDFS